MITNYLAQPGVIPVFPKYGVFYSNEEGASALPIVGAYFEESNPNNLIVDFAGDQPGAFPIEPTNVTINKNTGTIKFKAFDSEYTIRELREEDGLWLSTLKTSLSEEILDTLIDQMRRHNPMTYIPGESDPQGESLEALASDDSVYIIGLMYKNEFGNWARIDGDWSLVSPNEDAYAGAIVVPIDTNKADEFIKFYDNNYVTITDAEKYEVVEEAPTEKQ